jgi:hypothetical protein
LRALDDVLGDDVRHSSGSTIVTSVRVFSSTRPEVDGLYVQRDGTVSVPVKFAEVCLKNGWDVDSTWSALNGGAEGVWFAHSAGETKNPSYVYFNKTTGAGGSTGPTGWGCSRLQARRTRRPARPSRGERWTGRRTNRRSRRTEKRERFK